MSKSLKKLLKIRKKRYLLFFLLVCVSYLTLNHFYQKKWVRSDDEINKIILDNLLRIDLPSTIKASVYNEELEGKEYDLHIEKHRSHFFWENHGEEKLEVFSGVYIKDHITRNPYHLLVSKDKGFVMIEYQNLDVVNLCYLEHSILHKNESLEGTRVLYFEFKKGANKNLTFNSGYVDEDFFEYLEKKLCSNMQDLVFYPKKYGLFPYDNNVDLLKSERLMSDNERQANTFFKIYMPHTEWNK